MDQDLITAKECRDMGLAVPTSIPDYATVPRAAMRWEDIDCRAAPADREGMVVNITVRVSFDMPFSWVDQKLVARRVPNSAGA